MAERRNISIFFYDKADILGFVRATSSSRKTYFFDDFLLKEGQSVERADGPSPEW